MRAILTKSCVNNHIKMSKTKRDAVHSFVIRSIFLQPERSVITLSLDQEQKAVPTLAIPPSTHPHWTVGEHGNMLTQIGTSHTSGCQDLRTPCTNSLGPFPRFIFPTGD